MMTKAKQFIVMPSVEYNRSWARSGWPPFTLRGLKAAKNA